MASPSLTGRRRRLDQILAEHAEHGRPIDDRATLSRDELVDLVVAELGDDTRWKGWAA